MSTQRPTWHTRTPTSETLAPRRGGAFAEDVDESETRDRSRPSGSRREFTSATTRLATTTEATTDETSIAENRDSNRRRTTLPASSVGAIEEGGYEAVESRLVTRLRNLDRANRLAASKLERRERLTGGVLPGAHDGRPENVTTQQSRDRYTSPQPAAAFNDDRDDERDADDEQRATRRPAMAATTRRRLEFTSRSPAVEEANDGYDAPTPRSRATTRPRPRTAASRDADDFDELPRTTAFRADANDYEQAADGYGGRRGLQLSASHDSDERKEPSNASLADAQRRPQNDSADEPLVDEARCPSPIADYMRATFQNLDRTTLTIARLLNDNALNTLSRRDAAKMSPLKTAKKVRVVHLPPMAADDGSEEVVLVGEKGNATIYRGRSNMFIHASRVVRRI